MSNDYSKLKYVSYQASNRTNSSNLAGKVQAANSDEELIRFEEKKERYVWTRPEEIIFVKSADHYVKSLIKCGGEKKWVTRHSTLKDLLVLLPQDIFIRLNRFYLLNRNYFSHFNENEKKLYLIDDFCIPISHRISPYLCHLLITPHT